MEDATKLHVKNTVYDSCGINLANDQLDDVCNYFDNEIARNGIDTVVREGIANYLARRIVGRAWPTYGEAKEVKEAFYLLLKEKCKELGYEYTE